VLVLSDSCHSGTVTRARKPPPVPAGQRRRLMPDAIGAKVYAAHQAMYDRLQADVAKAAAAERSRAQQDPDAALAQVAQVALTGPAAQATVLVGRFKPSVLLISGCQDNQFSMDGDNNGAFTGELLAVWNKGKFSGNYTQLHAQVRSRMPASQSPNLFTLGPAAAFLKQAPFAV